MKIKMSQNLWDKTLKMLGEKCITLNAYIRKKEKFQIQT